MEKPLALVTGGARRIGAAIVEALAQEGMDIAIHYQRSYEEATSTCARARKLGAQAWMLHTDLARESQARGLVRRASERAGRPVTLLVNNASAFPSTTPVDATWQDLEESFHLHHRAPLMLMRGIAEQRTRASVVNVLDAIQPEHDLGHFGYQAGKNALASLTRVMARALAPRVRVNAVAPGAILAPEGSGPDHLEEIARGLPLGVAGSPSDVANAVVYLAKATFVTGVTLHVDGGSHLQGGDRS